MTQIYFTNTDNFTINNDDEQLTSLVEALESNYKREAIAISLNNTKEACMAAVKSLWAFCDTVTRSN